MLYDANSRTFRGKMKDIGQKKHKLVTIEVDCGDEGVAVFKLSISRSPKDNPEIQMRAKKPKTGEWKRTSLMAVPVAREAVDEDT